MTFEELVAQHEDLKTKYVASFSELAKLADQNQYLKLKLEKLQAMLWGRSSERRVPEGNAREQQFLFQAGELPTTPSKVEPPEQNVNSYKRRQARPKSAEEHEEGILPAHLPRKVDEKDELPPGVKKEDCRYMGIKVTERLGEEPSQLVVNKTVRHVYKDKKSGEFYSAPAPRHVLGRCQADESFLVNMVVKKILYHSPLYRQYQALKLYGVNIPRQNFVNWMIKLGGVFSPVDRAVYELILEQSMVHCDESPFLVGKRNEAGQKAYGEGYIWPILAPSIGVAFTYRSGRSSVDGKAVLGNFSGTLVSDAYPVYESLVAERSLSWQLCMMHIRRNFVDAEQSNAERAKEAQEFIRKLYAVEAAAKKMTPAKRLELRIQNSRPIMDEFYMWLKTRAATPEALTSPLLMKAISYVYTRWDAACLFLKDGSVPIDNGADERALRPFKLGAKNWLFAASELGAQTLGVFYTLVGTCLMHAIHPYYYLLDLCKRIEQPGLTARDLVPHMWKTRFYDEATPEWLRLAKLKPG